MRVEKVTATNSGRVRSCWAGVGTLPPDFLSLWPLFSPLCPAALGLGSPFRAGRESGGRAPLLDGTLRPVSGILLAGLGMADGTGSRLEGLAAAPCGRDRR